MVQVLSDLASVARYLDGLLSERSWNIAPQLWHWDGVQARGGRGHGGCSHVWSKMWDLCGLAARLRCASVQALIGAIRCHLVLVYKAKLCAYKNTA